MFSQKTKKRACQCKNQEENPQGIFCLVMPANPQTIATPHFPSFNIVDFSSNRHWVSRSCNNLYGKTGWLYGVLHDSRLLLFSKIGNFKQSSLHKVAVW